MYRHLLLAAAISLSPALPALAQVNRPAAPASPGAPPSAAPTPPPGATAPAAPSASALKAGMVVKDATGAPVGTISQLGQTSDGQAAAMLNVDGQQIGILASNLNVDPGGAQAVSSLTKAQLLASAAAARGARPG